MFPWRPTDYITRNRKQKKISEYGRKERSRVSHLSNPGLVKFVLLAKKSTYVIFSGWRYVSCLEVFRNLCHVHVCHCHVIAYFEQRTSCDLVLSLLKHACIRFRLQPKISKI